MELSKLIRASGVESEALWVLESTWGQLQRTLQEAGYAGNEQELEIELQQLGFQLHRGTHARKTAKKAAQQAQWSRIAEACKSASSAQLLYVETARFSPTFDTSQRGMDLRALLSQIPTRAARPFVTLGRQTRVSLCVALAASRWCELGRASTEELVVVLGGALGPQSAVRPEPWQVSLQYLADQTGRSVRALHCPPGLSRWRLRAMPLFEAVIWDGAQARAYRSRVNVMSARMITDSKPWSPQVVIDPDFPDLGAPKASELSVESLGKPGAWSYRIRPR